MGNESFDDFMDHMTDENQSLWFPVPAEEPEADCE